MAILPYQQIKERSIYHSLISPFRERAVAHGMTYGCGCAGYDIRIAQDMVIQPLTLELGSSIERFVIPLDLTARLMNKSTLARIGLDVAVTNSGEPGWEGYLTIELFNKSSKPIEIKAGMPIAQMQFELLAEPTKLAYSGKYQGQAAGPQPAIFEIGDGA